MDDDEFRMEMHDLERAKAAIERTGTDLGERDLTDDQRSQLDKFMTGIGSPP
jgi:hypothetical protein